MSNMSRPIRPGRCMSAIAAAPSSATRWPICWPSPATTSPRNISSTTPARRSTCWRARSCCATARRLAKTIGEIPAGLYPGDYLVPVGQALAKEFGDRLLQMPDDEAMAIVKDRTIDAMMAMIREDLALLNVHHDVFFSERTLHADNAQEDPLGDQRPDAEGSYLQGQAAAAQGREAGRLGRSRADAVPLDRGRRRHRPAAGQVGRRSSPISPPMSPISRTRSTRGFDDTDLRARRRPWRLRQAHGSAGAGDVAATR